MANLEYGASYQRQISLSSNQQYKLSGKTKAIKQLNAAIRRANYDKSFKAIVNQQL
ncbi:MAG: hypothetical protein JST50_06340 [Bacteroidetes bacterium]|jgi:hypothetical protein|nr:hypothetical protein [Bacteroidota bacterium]